MHGAAERPEIWVRVVWYSLDLTNERRLETVFLIFLLTDPPQIPRRRGAEEGKKERQIDRSRRRRRGGGLTIKSKNRREASA
jgi:hypothetical protein